MELRGPQLNLRVLFSPAPYLLPYSPTYLCLLVLRASLSDAHSVGQ